MANMLHASVAMLLLSSVLTASDTYELRRWPDINGWLVALIKEPALGGEPVCLMMTGYDTIGTPQPHVWGIRFTSSGAAIVVNVASSNVIDTVEADILVDNYSLGRFPLSGQAEPFGDWRTTFVDLPTGSFTSRIAELLKLGGKISITMGALVLEQQLDEEASERFERCRRELHFLLP